MRILYVTTIGSTMGFFKDLIKQLIDDGHIVDIATNESQSKVQECFSIWGCQIYHISTSRSPLSIGNIKAINQIRRIAKTYDIVHCHTPIAGIATRIGCRSLRKKGLRVIYTAHGFHFYKGAPKKNWVFYYPLEKLCSKWTDVLITINTEDYSLARKKMRAAIIEYVPGVGIDINRFSNTSVSRFEKIKEFNISSQALIVLSVGELNANKNHKAVIEALSRIDGHGKEIHYLIAGMGELFSFLGDMAKSLNVNLHLLGYRDDVAELYKITDLYVHPSFREGLPVSLMEAIASKANVICSNIRGCNDLVHEGLFNPNNCAEIEMLLVDYLFNKQSNREANYEHLYNYSLEAVNGKMKSIYGID